MTKTRYMRVSKEFHNVIYKWGAHNDAGFAAPKITDKLAVKLKNELQEKKERKKKDYFPF